MSYFSIGYLTPKQRRIWSWRRDGLSEGEIAEQMGVSRQAVNHAIHTIDLKVSRALMEAAKINRIEMSSPPDPVKGILVGYSHEFGVRALITYSAANGIQVWYEHEGRCEDCRYLKECQEILLREAEERDITLTDSEKRMPPSKLAQTIFQKILSERR